LLSYPRDNYETFEMKRILINGGNKFNNDPIINIVKERNSQG
jgi:hypothetical protein